MRHQVTTAVLAAAFVAAALAAGAYRKAALVGATTAGFTAVASMVGMGLAARAPSKPMQRVLLVFTVVFLARIVLVALGTALVASAGENVWAFILALFVPFFVFYAVEISYLNTLRHTGGTPA